MMTNKNIKTEKASRRFSLRWQLALGMALGFFAIFIIFALLVTERLQKYYGRLPNELYHWLELIVIAGSVTIFVFAIVLARYILRPVKSIQTTIKALADDPMTDIRASEIGANDELSDLVRVIASLLEHGKHINLVLHRHCLFPPSGASPDLKTFSIVLILAQNYTYFKCQYYT